jgi:hypothetical protein
MRLAISILLAFILNHGTSQQLNVSYRTSTEENQPLHYVTFIDKEHCQLTFPAGHLFPPREDFDLTYKRSGDTIVFSKTGRDTANFAVRRLRNAHFILKSDNTMYDLVSGYTYVDKKSINYKYTIYAIDGKIFKQRTTKKNWYSLMSIRDYRTSRRLKRKVKQIDLDKCAITIARGKAAYDKYGLVGMNGVIEIDRKKVQ